MFLENSMKKLYINQQFHGSFLIKVSLFENGTLPTYSCELYTLCVITLVVISTKAYTTIKCHT